MRACDRRNTPQSARRIKRVCVIVCCSLPDETIDRKKKEEKRNEAVEKIYIYFRPRSIYCRSVVIVKK